MEKDKMLSMRLSKEDKKLLEEDAKKEQRSASNLLLYCWREWRKKGK